MFFWGKVMMNHQNLGGPMFRQTWLFSFSCWLHCRPLVLGTCGWPLLIDSLCAPCGQPDVLAAVQVVTLDSS